MLRQCIEIVGFHKTSQKTKMNQSQSHPEHVPFSCIQQNPFKTCQACLQSQVLSCKPQKETKYQVPDSSKTLATQWTHECTTPACTCPNLAPHRCISFFKSPLQKKINTRRCPSTFVRLQRGLTGWCIKCSAITPVIIPSVQSTLQLNHEGLNNDSHFNSGAPVHINYCGDAGQPRRRTFNQHRASLGASLWSFYSYLFGQKCICGILNKRSSYRLQKII